MVPYVRCSFENSECEDLLPFENGTLVEQWVRVQASGNQPAIDHTMKSGGDASSNSTMYTMAKYERTFFSIGYVLFWFGACYAKLILRSISPLPMTQLYNPKYSGCIYNSHNKMTHA